MTITEMAQRLIRIGAPQRVARASGVPAVERFLFRHPDGGWLQSSERERMRTARRLLFLLWLVSEGKVSDA